MRINRLQRINQLMNHFEYSVPVSVRVTKRMSFFVVSLCHKVKVTKMSMGVLYAMHKSTVMPSLNTIA